MKMKSYIKKTFTLEMQSLNNGYRAIVNNRVYFFSKDFDVANDMFSIYQDKIEKETRYV